ncbi:hypothetical protein [Microbacterium gorillae]|uniref:hypothetical protein n=1 Tax=Microbacterium gorillae TaxID=1231063 RepID=UPI00058DC631|nr:hypothetical protein [Microbacterium gorillae]
MTATAEPLPVSGPTDVVRDAAPSADSILRYATPEPRRNLALAIICLVLGVTSAMVPTALIGLGFLQGQAGGTTALAGIVWGAGLLLLTIIISVVGVVICRPRTMPLIALTIAAIWLAGVIAVFTIVLAFAS